MSDVLVSDLIKFTRVARTLEVHLCTLHRWRLAGRLPAVKVGGRWYCERACIEGLLQAPARARRPPPVAPQTPDWARRILDAAKL